MGTSPNDANYINRYIGRAARRAETRWEAPARLRVHDHGDWLLQRERAISIIATEASDVTYRGVILMATATADGTLFSTAMAGTRLVRVARRGPLLRPQVIMKIVNRNGSIHRADLTLL